MDSPCPFDFVNSTLADSELLPPANAATHTLTLTMRDVTYRSVVIRVSIENTRIVPGKDGGLEAYVRRSFVSEDAAAAAVAAVRA